MTIIRIPQRFYNDHVDRDLPAPDIVKATRRHYWINTNHPHFAELMNDANHYGESPLGWDSETWKTYGRAARALINAARTQT
ncbi:hypothetical protein LCGC14_0653840 [marine sediment metagenome]|uniref:Uncharacterized protein n=1 Tax=marine sediment metagenome TaxID=412755 RepID=A0A0F9R0U0_9ZZZZ